MKVKKVVANLRTKAFDVLAGGRKFSFPFSRLKAPPTRKDPIVKLYIDPEVAWHGFTYVLASGVEDTILLDQILDYLRDPEYVRKEILLHLFVRAERRIEELGISKREIIRRMGSTPTQFYRLMDPRNVGKTIDQMLKLLAALDCTVDIVVKNAA